MEVIAFGELINGAKVGTAEKYRAIRNYTLKQISRCRFEIDGEKCFVLAKYKEDIVSVEISNDISVYEFSQLLYVVNDEPSPQFLHDKIRLFDCTLIEMLEEYKQKYYESGEKLKDEVWYKIYSRDPLSCEFRKVYDATWIDYEGQLESGDIIYDEGIAGLWAMPAELMLQCFNEECVERYGNRVFIVKPVDGCFYLNDGKEIIGEKYRVIDSISLEDTTDMGKLMNYLLDSEKAAEKKLLAEKEKEKDDIRKDRDNYLAAVRDLQDDNLWLQKRNKMNLAVGIILGLLISFIVHTIL